LFRVPFRNLVVGLMSHQLLIQAVGSLLLSGTTNVVPAEQGILVNDSLSHQQQASSSGSAGENNLMSNSVVSG
jgi:hypothetical protein